MNDDQCQILDSIRECVSYDPETGVFTWLQRPARRCHIGSRAGTISNGRRYITIGGRKYGCARLGWWMNTGAMPKFDIDHIDGDKLNDKFTNLRDVTARVNGENIRSAKRHNRLGVLGVRAHRQRYEARITVNGKEIALGRYETPQEASDAYVTAKRRLHEGCTL